jgi:hypothetical protein
VAKTRTNGWVYSPECLEYEFSEVGLLTDSCWMYRKSTPGVFRPDPPGEDHHPHACHDGLVFLTYTVWDPEIGDEVERIKSAPCRRCAIERETS